MEAIKLQNNQLKKDNDTLRQKLRECEIRFNEERERNRRLLDNLKNVRNNYILIEREHQEIAQEKDNLIIQLRRLQARKEHFEPIIFRKKWDKLESSKTKLKRKRKYKEIVDKSLRYITECKRAKLSLTVGKSDINLKWSEKEVRKHRWTFRDNNLLPHTNDSESMSSDNETDEDSDSHLRNQKEKNKDNQSEIEDQLSEDDSEILTTSDNEESEKDDIFDTKCNYTRRHTRQIVTVMDKHHLK